MINNENVLENPEKVEKIGKFKPTKKFLSFVAAKSTGKNKFRFITNSALIRGNQFGGLGLDGIVLKLTICSEGTVDLEEIDTNRCDGEMLGRFVEDLCDREITGYAGKFIISSTEFYTDDLNRLYLEIEHQKPIEKLASMLDDFSETEVNFDEVKISEKSKSFLDDLFSDDEVEVKDKTSENLIVDVSTDQKDSQKVNAADQKRSYIDEAFQKMNQDKIDELSERVKNHEKNVIKNQMEIKEATKSLNKNLKDLKILNNRLESLTPAEPANGYCFFLSEEKKTGIEPDEKLVEIVGKISPILRLIPDRVVELLTAGFHTINIAKADSYDKKLDLSKDVPKEELEERKKIYKKIESIDLAGHFKLISESEIEYRGELKYHELLTKLIRAGFSQIPEFNKICGSNSYGSKESLFPEKVEEANRILKDVDMSILESKNCHENCKCDTPCDDTCNKKDTK